MPFPEVRITCPLCLASMSRDEDVLTVNREHIAHLTLPESAFRPCENNPDTAHCVDADVSDAIELALAPSLAR